MTTKKHTIWSSHINMDDWQDYLKEEHPTVTDEYEQYRLCAELNDCYLDDERVNLNIPCTVLGIAEIGRWNGISRGFHFFDNIKEILYTSCDDAEWYLENDVIKGVMHHHDGTNYVTYYLCDTNKDGFEDFEEEMHENCGALPQETIEKYCSTMLLAEKVKAVYGW